MSSEAGAAGRVFFTEVGPRDGLQNLPVELPTEVKLELLEGVLESGADLVEATSFVSPTWVPKLADAEELMRQLVTSQGPDVLFRIRVLVPNRRGLARALEASARRVVVNVGATDAFNQRNLNRSVSETMAEIAELAQEAARTQCLWDASLSVAFGCPYEGRVAPERVLELACELAAMGAFEISVADTLGVADPEAVSRLIDLLAKELPADRVSLHLHDTRGMGLANVLAGYQAGVRRFEGSVGGIGGCPFAPRSTGNVCSEDLLYMLRRTGATVAVDIDRLCRVAQQLEGMLGHELPGRLYRAGPWDPDAAGATGAQPE
ncbi:MAG TPA: hydroxymethylglutaryl-CoA lyase [Candidatus Saccharimonadales bacterium]|nr:hydroxymethylglutaryl-CoA lyase [Candidatus Saccharimonadales bacterium]